ncbi:hypothetical protein Clacol_003717 [Clathrus columnatus]|uniref:Uncharacterized protein n=1 Tax=Clathrus columnatus TaxID=1419009 RepID=A0AAV5A4D2_9AGAM|nr:hypothetical protein Clacol_003717 [Clathrus columnatus]
MRVIALVSFPDAPLTEKLIRNALVTKIPSIEIVDEIPPNFDRLLQICTYDRMDHELTHLKPESVLSSSYIIRKSIIRKHFLNRTISAYTSKYPESLLKSSIPRTWDFDIVWADELGDLFADELWELGEILDGPNNVKWFILKAGMTDSGNGIRLFNSKEQLQLIFNEFDEKSDIEDSDEQEGGQEIITSQLRHFVIQEYLSNPLLLDPHESVVPGECSSLEPYKVCYVKQIPSALPLSRSYQFHLRAYCVASGALTVYLWEHILALFASVPYVSPEKHDEPVNLQAHLTNTALIKEGGESFVLLLSELAGRSILSVSEHKQTLTTSDINIIIDHLAVVIGQVFRAAIASPIHFQKKFRVYFYLHLRAV